MNIVKKINKQAILTGNPKIRALLYSQLYLRKWLAESRSHILIFLVFEVDSKVTRFITCNSDVLNTNLPC